MAKLAKYVTQENLVEKYEEVIKSFGMVVDEGYIFTSEDEENREQAKSKGLPLALPTDEHIRTMTNSTGEIVKLPFNPFMEDAFAKAESTSIKLVKNGIVHSLQESVWRVGVLLMKIGLDDKLKNKVGYEVSKYLANLKDVHKNRKINDDITEDTLLRWKSYFDKKLTDVDGPLDILKINIRRAAKIGSDKFDRVTTLYSPLYDSVCKTGKDLKNVKWPAKTENGKPHAIRNADAIIFKVTLEFIFAELSTNKTLQVGSNDERRPAFLSAYQLYIALAGRINILCDELKIVDEMFTDKARIAIPNLDLDDLDKYNATALSVPNEKDMKMAVADIISTKEKLKGEEAVNSALGLTTINSHNANKTSNNEQPTGLEFLNSSRKIENVDNGSALSDILSGKTPSNKPTSVQNNDSDYNDNGEYVEKVHKKYDVNNIYRDAPTYTRGTSYRGSGRRDSGRISSSRSGRGGRETSDDILSNVLTGVRGRNFK